MQRNKQNWSEIDHSEATRARISDIVCGIDGPMRPNGIVECIPGSCNSQVLPAEGAGNWIMLVDPKSGRRTSNPRLLVMPRCRYDQ